LIEHNIDVVSGLCDRVFVMDFGSVVTSGLPADVLASDIVRTAYLGAGGETHEAEPVASGGEIHEAEPVAVERK
jgi:ABC-type methionine transport system ATPase subunit